MGVMTRAQVDTQQAFDGVAAGYDRSNAANPLLCAMRKRVRRTIAEYVPAGSRILDLGCGPGTDAADLARPAIASPPSTGRRR
jgi:ubiquinone/menaquinone biosynthesis C-methylase UbiE